MEDRIRKIRNELSINKQCLVVFELKNGRYIKDETAIIEKISKKQFTTISSYNVPIEMIDHVEVSFYEKIGSIIVLASDLIEKDIHEEERKFTYHNKFKELNNASLSYLSLHSSKRTSKGEKCLN